jgi:hypothetical protein
MKIKSSKSIIIKKQYGFEKLPIQDLKIKKIIIIENFQMKSV